MILSESKPQVTPNCPKSQHGKQTVLCAQVLDVCQTGQSKYPLTLPSSARDPEQVQDTRRHLWANQGPWVCVHLPLPAAVRLRGRCQRSLLSVGETSSRSTHTGSPTGSELPTQLPTLTTYRASRYPPTVTQRPKEAGQGARSWGPCWGRAAAPTHILRTPSSSICSVDPETNELRLMKLRPNGTRHSPFQTGSPTPKDGQAQQGRAMWPKVSLKATCHGDQQWG